MFGMSINVGDEEEVARVLGLIDTVIKIVKDCGGKVRALCNAHNPSALQPSRWNLMLMRFFIYSSELPQAKLNSWV